MFTREYLILILGCVTHYLQKWVILFEVSNVPLPCFYKSNFNVMIGGPAVCKRRNLVLWATSVARVPHGPQTTAESPKGRVQPDQDTHGDGMGRGRGHGTGPERRLGRQEVRDRGDQRG